MNIEELNKKIDKMGMEFEQIYRRMDGDFALWLQTPEGSEDYSLVTKAFQGKRETEISFVSPNPRSYADHVHSRIASAERQIICRVLEKEGEDKRAAISKLERLINFAFEKADERLTGVLQLPGLLDYSIWTGMLRGRMAGRFLVREAQENVIFDFLPYDPRYFSYEIGRNGIKSTCYKTYRSAVTIKDEYGKEARAEENNEVRDYWELVEPGKIINTVICGNEFLLEPQTHLIPCFPIQHLAVGGIPPINSAGTLGTVHGDSIYAAARSIYKFENDLISMWASHAKLLYKQPIINYYDEEGLKLTTTSFMAEDVINVPMGHNKLEASPTKEISQTLVNLVGFIGSLRQRATLPDIEFGELRNFPLSGTAINELQQARDKIYGPLIRALNIYYTNISNLLEQQLISKELSVKVQSEVAQKYFEVNVEPVDLKVPHIIRVEFTSRTPWTQLDSYQIGDMAKRLGLPDEFIWEFILKVPDPKGLTDQVAIEIAEHSPTLMRLRAIKVLLNQGREDEAKSLIEELYTEWLQQQQIQSPEQREVGSPGEAQEAPMLAGEVTTA